MCRLAATWELDFERLSTWAAGKALLQTHTYDMSLAPRVNFDGRCYSTRLRPRGRPRSLGLLRILDRPSPSQGLVCHPQSCSSVVAKRSTVLRAALSAACSHYLADVDDHNSVHSSLGSPDGRRDEGLCGSRDEEGPRCLLNGHYSVTAECDFCPVL